jgi:hypothetical protein
MSIQPIPSLLQGKLQERSAENFGSTLIVEVGEFVVSYALQRSKELEQNQKKTINSGLALQANKPSVLLLLSQEVLASAHVSSQSKGMTFLSETQSPRDDLSSLSNSSRVLATTPQRAIDHIRRDNIFLSQTQSVILAYDFLKDVDETEEQMQFRKQAFLDDCRFIFTKLNADTHIELYVDALSHLTRSPEELTEHTIVLSRADWERSRITLACYASPLSETDRILDILYALQEPQYIVVHKDDAAWQKLERRFRTTVPPLTISKIGLHQLSMAQKKVKVFASTVFAIGLSSGELIALIHALNEWETPPHRIVCITEPHDAQEIITSKETLLMNTEKKSLPESEEVLAGKIQMLAAKLAIDSHPEELENLRKLFKKFVPFHRRGYFTAYLLRELLGTDKRGSQSQKNLASSSASTTRVKNTPKTAEERPQRVKRGLSKSAKTREIPEGARTLYLNIGKMRRLYAKELSQILQDQLQITADDIFAIRVHDKYSFITLTQEHADKAIEKMNGMDIRGRTAAISYSNKE